MIKAIKSYETSDGGVFAKREDAERYEAMIAVRAWIENSDIIIDANLLVRLIQADPDKARAVLAPLMPVKRHRASKAKPKKKATVAEYESMLAKDAA